MAHLTGDLLGLLDLLDAERAVVVGHDWGSMIAWNLAQRHPERLRGVVGMSVPFVPRGSNPPIATIRAALGDTFFYMVYFQEPGVAEADLDADPAETMLRFLAGMGTTDPEASARMSAPYGDMGMVERLAKPEGLPDWLTQDELDVYAAEFSRTGFHGGISWYRNIDRNWERSEDLAGVGVDVPALFLTGSQDPVNLMLSADTMPRWVPDLRGSHVIDGAGHWVQQEKPDEVNAFLLEFLAGLDV